MTAAVPDTIAGNWTIELDPVHDSRPNSLPWSRANIAEAVRAWWPVPTDVVAYVGPSVHSSTTTPPRVPRHGTARQRRRDRSPRPDAEGPDALLRAARTAQITQVVTVHQFDRGGHT